MTGHSEKRSISRADLHQSCQLNHNGQTYDADIVNFSLTGFLVHTHAPLDLPEGAVLSLQIPEGLTGQADSDIYCQVVWIADSTIGLHFHSIDFDTLMALKDLLEHLMEHPEKLDEEILKQLEK